MKKIKLGLNVRLEEDGMIYTVFDIDSTEITLLGEDLTFQYVHINQIRQALYDEWTYI